MIKLEAFPLGSVFSKFIFITGKRWLPYDLEESETDSKMREENLINEFGMKDGENFDKLNDKVYKNYELSFENPGPKAWWHKSSSRRLSRSRIWPDCVYQCEMYRACIRIRLHPWCNNFGCSCYF